MRLGTGVLRVATTLAFIAQISGCGSDAGSGGKVVESPNLGDSTKQEITAADGGKVELEEAGVLLDIPAGALASDETITAEIVSKKGLPKADTLLGNVVELGPDGLEFELPVTLTLELGDAEVPKNAEVSIAWYDEDADAWVDLEGSALSGGKVTAQTTHFTMFAVRFVLNDDGEIVQEGGMCSDDFEACGGDLVGTWNIVSGCATFGDLGGSEGAPGECSGASISVGADITGDIVITDTTVKGTLNMMSTITTAIPKKCAPQGMCPAPDPEDPEEPVFEDKGDTCEASETETNVQEIDETYTADDGNFVTMDESGEPGQDTTTYCVKGDTLVVNTLTSEGQTIRWTAERK